MRTACWSTFPTSAPPPAPGIDDECTEVGETPEENEDESDDDDGDELSMSLSDDDSESSDGDELWISLSDDDSVFIHSIESPFDPKQDRRAS